MSLSWRGCPFFLSCESRTREMLTVRTSKHSLGRSDVVKCTAMSGMFDEAVKR